MGDLIDRQVAIDAIGKILPVNPGLNEYTHGITIGASLAMEYIKQLPSVQSEPGWIPVSERLPEKGSFALVTDFGEVEEAYYDSDGHWWQVWGDRLKNVTAWMPLPEPYEEAKNAKV